MKALIVPQAPVMVPFLTRSTADLSFASIPFLTLASGTGRACPSAINANSLSFEPTVSRMVIVLEAAGTTPIQVGAKQLVATQTPFTTSGSRAKLTYSSVTASGPAGRLVGLAYQSLRLIFTLNV